jgi:hypothetical protein
MNKIVEKNHRFAGLYLPIVSAAIADADVIASEQSNPVKAESVRRNILAVWAVKSYLEMMGYKTDLGASLCRDPLALFAGIEGANLFVKDLEGSIECLAVSSEDSTVQISQTERDDRLAYLLVEIETGENYSSKLLGFWKTLPKNQNVTELAINDPHLKSPEDFIDYCCDIEEKQQMIIHLKRRVRDMLAQGWQLIEELISPDFQGDNLVPAYGFVRGAYGVAKGARGGDQETEELRGLEEEKQPSSSFTTGIAKVYEYNLPIKPQAVVLSIEIERGVNQEIDVLVRVCPRKDDKFLPSGLTLKVTLNLDTDDPQSRDQVAGKNTSCLEIEPFSVLLGEKFKVEVSLGDITFSEELSF